jgi:hypothetical protein
LRDIEEGEPLQEQDRLCFLASFLFALFLIIGRETVGIDGSCAPADCGTPQGVIRRATSSMRSTQH